MISKLTSAFNKTKAQAKTIAVDRSMFLIESQENYYIAKKFSCAVATNYFLVSHPEFGLFKATHRSYYVATLDSVNPKDFRELEIELFLR